MRNFRIYILTYNGHHLKFNSMLSASNRKVYTADNGDQLTVCSASRGVSYTIEINTKKGTQYFTVESRRGVYSCLTYYELLVDDDERDFLISQYGSIQHYLDDICCSSEYIKDAYNMKGGAHEV